MLIPKHSILFCFLFCIGIKANAQTGRSSSVAPIFNNTESITGKPQNLVTPYNTAGDKLYMVGHQDGTFPDLGWHVKGEMGGIWQHPIKLLDGFEAGISVDHKRFELNKADAFVNFPFGNKHIYNTFSDEISIERFQFVPDQMGAVYIEFLIKNNSNKTVKIDFDVKAISNLMPVWLGDRTGMIDGKDNADYDKVNNYWIAKDASNPWFVVYGSTYPAKATESLPSKSHKPNTSTTHTQYSFEIKPGSTISFPLIVAGSATGKEEAIKSYTEISKKAFEFISKKKERVLKLNDKSKLTLNDKELETTFRWLKYNSDWLALDVDGMGKGVVAGIPDYPWWFGGDMVYTLRGLITTGRKDLVYSTIELIHKISEKNNGNGRIIHEVSTNGAVYNLGLISETPQFVSLIWDIFCWTGEMKFLNKYFPTIEKGLHWLLTENDLDGNLIADGHGMMEIQGLDSEMIDVAVYSQRAFSDAAMMAKILGKETLAKEYESKAAILKEKVNTIFWNEDFQSYADFLSTKEQALNLTDSAIERASKLKNNWAVTELKETKSKIEKDPSTGKKSFVIYHNWVVNTPMETGIADPEKAIKALNTAKKFTNPYGMFVTGIDRNENADKDENSYAATTKKDEFTYTGTVMTLPTGVQIISENNYGRPDEAYDLLKKVSKTFSYALPGSMYEVSPDYGMMTQAWNIYAYGEPIVEQFFGIKPMAYKKEITISPMLPLAMSEGKIENVVIGNNEITMRFSQKPNVADFIINQKQNDWSIMFSQPKGKYKKWILNGKAIKPALVGEVEQIKITGKVGNLKLIK
ncbi:MAG: alpha-L-rhamnosidase-related protein [Flavitalea sp.]